MGRSAQISPTHFGRELLYVCRYRRAKAQYGGDDFLHESLPFAWRWKRNSAVRQVNARFEVGRAAEAGRRERNLAVGEAAVAIECETEMRSQRSDGRVLLRIGIGIGCGNDDDPEPAAVLATRRQHRRTQRIALPVAQREEKRHLSLYMGLEADVALD